MTVASSPQKKGDILCPDFNHFPARGWNQILPHSWASASEHCPYSLESIVYHEESDHWYWSSGVYSWWFRHCPCSDYWTDTALIKLRAAGASICTQQILSPTCSGKRWFTPTWRCMVPNICVDPLLNPGFWAVFNVRGMGLTEHSVRVSLLVVSHTLFYVAAFLNINSTS